MLWPTAVPHVTRGMLASWSSLSYPKLCAAVLKLFVPIDDPEVSHADLDAIVLSAFSAFGSASVVDVVGLEASLHVAELWHGPTLAFKDLGMAVLGRTLSHLLARRRQRLTLLVGTSGDTGSSAIEAVRGLPAIEIVVLYPLQSFSSISAVQERQMTSVAEVEPNVHVIGVEGTSDDLDVPMEACFRDGRFKAAHHLGSVNSVNVLRLLVQSVHFFYAYLRLEPTAEGTVQLAIPCGAAGHLAAGLLAVQMGLPARLLAATNANDALHRILSTGSLQSGVPTVPTVSPSMDIQMPYNLWRLLFVASGADGDAVRGWQAELARTGSLQLPPHICAWMSRHVRSVAVADDEALGTMRAVHAATGYVLDPHTAVGVAAAKRTPFDRDDAGGRAEPLVCMGCAHAVKFLPAVARAFGCEEAAALGMLGERSHPNVAAVRAMAQQLMAAAPTPPKRPTPWAPAAAAAGEGGRGAGRGMATTTLETPPGCTAVFRRGEDWEVKLRALLGSVVARGRTADGHPRSKL